MTYQLTEKVCNTAVRNIRNQGKEKECPGHRVQESLLDLIQLEVLVTDTLLVDAHSGNSQNAILLVQPACIQLAIWDNPQENNPQHDSRQTGNEEDDLPRCDQRSVFFGADGDSIRNATTDYLADAVEAEPNINTTALLFLRIPLQSPLAMLEFWGSGTYLRSQQRKARRNSRLKDTKEQANGNRPRIALHSREAAQNNPPHHNTGSGILPQRQPLQQTVGRILPRQIA